MCLVSVFGLKSLLCLVYRGTGKVGYVTRSNPSQVHQTGKVIRHFKLLIHVHVHCTSGPCLYNSEIEQKSLKVGIHLLHVHCQLNDY